MGKGALRPFFKGHSLKKEKEHEKKEVDKMLSHFVTLPFSYNTLYSFLSFSGAGKLLTGDSHRT
jgi:hypothetical protein